MQPIHIRRCGTVGSIAAEFRRPAKAAAGLGESTWDVMAALPILQGLGIENTIDWKRTDLSSKLRFVCGSPDLLAVFEPLMKGRGSTAGSVASA